MFMDVYGRPQILGEWFQGTSIYIYVYIGIAASNLHMLGQILTWSGNRRASGAAADVNIWTTNRTVFDYRISPVQTNSECKQTKLVFNGFSSSTNGEFCIAWFMYRMDSEGLASYGCPLVNWSLGTKKHYKESGTPIIGTANDSHKDGK